jgi:hypothetical protein
VANVRLDPFVKVVEPSASVIFTLLEPERALAHDLFRVVHNRSVRSLPGLDRVIGYPVGCGAASVERWMPGEVFA